MASRAGHLRALKTTAHLKPIQLIRSMHPPDLVSASRPPGFGDFHAGPKLEFSGDQRLAPRVTLGANVKLSLPWQICGLSDIDGYLFIRKRTVMLHMLPSRAVTTLARDSPNRGIRFQSSPLITTFDVGDMAFEAGRTNLTSVVRGGIKIPWTWNPPIEIG